MIVMIIIMIIKTIVMIIWVIWDNDDNWDQRTYNQFLGEWGNFVLPSSTQNVGFGAFPSHVYQRVASKNLNRTIPSSFSKWWIQYGFASTKVGFNRTFPTKMYGSMNIPSLWSCGVAHLPSPPDVCNRSAQKSNSNTYSTHGSWKNLWLS